MGQTYDAAQKARAMGLMRTSAAKSPDGSPNYTRLEAELAITRSTLRKWWKEAAPDDGDESPPAPATPGEAPSATGPGAADRAWASEQLGEPDTSNRDVKLIADLYYERNSYTSPTARAAASKHLADKVIELRRNAPTHTGPASEEEWVDLVSQMPEVVLACWLRDPALWDDERWLAARDAQGPARG